MTSTATPLAHGPAAFYGTDGLTGYDLVQERYSDDLPTLVSQLQHLNSTEPDSTSGKAAGAFLLDSYGPFPLDEEGESAKIFYQMIFGEPYPES
jgi:hypothetical protein